MKKVSLKDIAGKVGVSNATVSLVLSGNEKKGRVSREMSDIIRATAREMNYQPNNIARSLRVGRSQTIGLIVADISNSFFGSLAFHVQEEAEKFGYSVIITNTNENVDKMSSMIKLFRNRQVDGFIIVPTENGESEIQSLLDQSVPLVLLDRYFPFINCDYVTLDNYSASLEVTKLLIEDGCKNIAFVTYKNIQQHIMERRNGYYNALEYADLGNNSNIKQINYSNINDDMENAIDELFEENNPVKTDGIFFATNSLSQVGLKYLRKKNIELQKDVRIVCFDKSEAFDILSIPIPYILQPLEGFGKKSVELLIEQIEKGNGEVRNPKSVKLRGVLHNPFFSIKVNR
jgi:LacI family transcriptional regulator